MTEQHPITPPPELIRKWDKEAATVPMADQHYIAIQAARWGADQQLNADCEWLHRRCLISGAEELRAAMRPKPPSSLKEQALTQLDSLHADLKVHGLGTNINTIRCALEQLDD